MLRIKYRFNWTIFLFIFYSPVCRFLDSIKAKKYNSKIFFNDRFKVARRFVRLGDSSILCSSGMSVNEKMVNRTLPIIRKLMPLSSLKYNERLSATKSSIITYKLKYVPLIIFWNSLMIFCKKNYNTHMNAPCGAILSFPCSRNERSVVYEKVYYHYMYYNRRFDSYNCYSIFCI